MRWTGSKLSRFCAHSHVLADINPRPTREKAAKRGNIFHAALVDWYSLGRPPLTDDDEINGWLGTMIDHGWAWPDGCELEVLWGLSKWGTFVPVKETAPHVYESLDGEDLLTAGRADIDWPANEYDMAPLVVCDWKTGRTLAPPASDNLQVNAAGLALSQKWKTPGYQPCIYYAREGRWDIGMPVYAGTEEWAAALRAVRDAAALDDQPHPGSHCSDCWERKNCAVGTPEGVSHG